MFCVRSIPKLDLLFRPASFIKQNLIMTPENDIDDVNLTKDRKYLLEICEKASGNNADNAVKLFSEIVIKRQKIPDWAVVVFSANLAGNKNGGIEKAKQILMEHKNRTKHVYLRNRIYMEHQMQDIITQLLKSEVDGYNLAKSFYLYLVSIGLYKNRSTYVDQLLQYYLERNTLQDTFKEMQQMANILKHCSGAIPLITKALKMNENALVTEICTCIRKHNGHIQANSTLLFAYLDCGNMAKTLALLQKEFNPILLNTVVSDFIINQAKKRKKSNVLLAILDANGELKLTLNTRENVIISLGTIYANEMDVVGLKSLWEKLRKSDNLSFYTKAVGTLRHFFLRCYISVPDDLQNVHDNNLLL